MSQKQLYLYTVVDSKVVKDYSVVGVIDGSGSMKDFWPHLSAAWNEFIKDLQNVHCIQFDHRAVLQENPMLTEQLGCATTISLGFFELVKLIRSKKLKHNVIIVFITDGYGDDKVEDYIEKLASDFMGFHAQGYQFKLFTLAAGTSFSPQIVAELKNRIHNSNVISSQMEYIENKETDFTNKLQQIKEELFYNMVNIDPTVSLVPNGKKMSRVAPNQTIITDQSKIKVNNQVVDLKTYEVTYHDVYMMANQTMLKLMEDDTRGVKTIKKDSEKQLQMLQEMLKIVRQDQDENQDIKNDILETFSKIKNFTIGKRQINTFSAKEAAQQIAKVQEVVLKKTAIEQEKINQIIEEKNRIEQQQKEEARLERLRLKEEERRRQEEEQQRLEKEQIEKAKKRLAGMRKTVKIKTIIEPLEEFHKQNESQTPDIILKKLQENRGGLRLQRYSLDFEKECRDICEMISIIKKEK